MKGIACKGCGHVRVLSDEWIESTCVALQMPPSDDSIEAILPKLKCKDCGTREPLLLWMEVIPTGPNASSGHVCINCGEFLTVARVTAVPDAIRCLDCQTAWEKGGTAPPPGKGPGPAPAPLQTLDPKDQALFDALKAWRLEEAKAAGIPAYCILHDKTLHAIVELRPQSHLALQAIPGFGPSKIKNYGAAVIEIVLEFSP